MIPADRGQLPSSDLWRRLADPALFVASAERVRERQLETGHVRPLAPDGPWLQAVADLEGLARALARDVARGEYAFGPVSARKALIRGELRTLYVASPLDEIVLGALASVFGTLLEPFLSPHLYSYRRGRSALQAVRGFVRFLRAHRAHSAEPRDRGLYVLRRDVRSYGEAIASGPESRLWSLLEEALTHAGLAPQPAHLAWLATAFRPALLDADAASSRPVAGIPTGSALQPAACNLYLTPIDRLLESVPGGFYARYGDDMLFAHSDPVRVKKVALELDREVGALQLAWSPEKCAAFYFNAAGRRPALQHAEFQGTTALDYLGVRVDFSGVIGLKREKARRLLHDLQLRLAHTDRLLRGEPGANRERDLCAVANALLDPNHPSANPNAAALRYLVSDRGQLRDLDYRIALLVAQKVSARRGVRAFRMRSPRSLRRELGLVSLLQTRNRFGRRAASPASARG
jgi:Reverse transcriptase (RNA-dependent DNA polymerase)